MSDLTKALEQANKKLARQYEAIRATEELIQALKSLLSTKGKDK